MSSVVLLLSMISQGRAAVVKSENHPIDLTKMARKWNLEQAKKAAFRGEVTTALEALKQLANDGIHSAKASLANILAFRGYWDECISLAGDYLEHASLNDYQYGAKDMVLLLSLSGDKTRQWDVVLEYCVRALRSLETRAGMATEINCLDIIGDRNSYARTLKEDGRLHLSNLTTYALSKGLNSHTFYSQYYQPITLENQISQREQYYKNSVENLPLLRPDLTDSPDEAAAHRFHLAVYACQYQDALYEFLHHPDKYNHFQFKDALVVSRILCHSKQFGEAWQILYDWLPQWYPMQHSTRVAPMELLFDILLRPLMTPERCEEVLFCPKATDLWKRKKTLTSKPNATRMEKQEKIPALKIRSFIQAVEPVTKPVTKFGGQPTWLSEPQWPISRTLQKPMRFICQIQLEPKVFGQMNGRIAYLFVSDWYEEQPTRFWEAHSGDNAVIIQPGRTYLGLYDTTSTGPSLEREGLPCEYLVDFESIEEQSKPVSFEGNEFSAEQFQLISQDMACNKVGGVPFYWNTIEYPDDSGDWKLLLQLSEDVPFPLNCCLGLCYAFVSKDGYKGAYFCQSG